MSLRYFYDAKNKRYFSVPNESLRLAPFIVSGSKEVTEEEYNNKGKKPTQKKEPKVNNDRKAES